MQIVFSGENLREMSNLFMGENKNKGHEFVIC